MPKPRARLSDPQNSEQTIVLIPGALRSPFKLSYPAQFEGYDPSYDAELRGTYTDRWKPSWSRFGHPRGGAGHNGADLYAPVKTALVALVDGELMLKPQEANEDIGNRAWLVFKWNGVPHRFIYGHLHSFEGKDRSVRKGEVIGYVGCSGNADWDGMCTGKNKCGLSASHVHLMLKNDKTGVDEDPIVALGAKLRYADDTRDVPCVELFDHSQGAVPHSQEFVPILHQHRELLDQLRLVDELQQRRPAASALDAALERSAWWLGRTLGETVASASSPSNVNTGATEKERTKTFLGIARATVSVVDAGKPADFRENIARFLFHVAWHEGMRLTKRKQMGVGDGDGPARGFFQFEAHRAKDALLYAKQTKWLDDLATIGAVSEADLTAATQALPDYGSAHAPWFPTDNLVERLLSTNDEFGIYLARIAFRKISESIPTDNAGHAAYWYKHWKVTGGNPENLKAIFRQAADYADTLL